MMYVGGFFVDITFSDIRTLSPTLWFGFLYFVRGLMYKIESKLEIVTSLGDFPKDLLTQQFLVDTN